LNLFSQDKELALSSIPKLLSRFLFGSEKLLPICSLSAQGGYLKVVKWARKSGYPWSSDVTTISAQENHLKILTWSMRRGCPFNKYASHTAANSGNLECLKYLHEKGCEWDGMTCVYAATHQHIRAYIHSLPFGERPCECQIFT
jgi:hypothetical protein